jgi:sigma-B regulation protein RsbU (phosphoserine phosphatase)
MDKNKLELNAILDITQAINNNMSETNLYKVFELTCTSLLSGVPVGLVVLEDEIGHLVIESHFHLKEEVITSAINLASHAPDKCIEVSSDKSLPDINQLIRVRHKTKLLAVVLVGQSGNQSVSEHQLNLIKTVANIVMVAIENKRLARRQIQQEVMDRELSIAKKVQQNLVPDHLPSNDSFELFASYIPFGKVGGDYYDFVTVNSNEFLFLYWRCSRKRCSCGFGDV